MDSNKEFVWTDELVKEFMRESWMESNTYIPLAIESFKEKRTPKPKPLFVTEDGVEKFSKDSCWVVRAGDDWGIHKFGYIEESTIHSGWKYFHDIDKADEFILMNKIVFSALDVIDYINQCAPAPSDNPSNFYKLIDRAKQKLNNK